MQRTSWRLSAAGPAGRRTLVARRSLPIIRRCAISWRPLGQFDVVFCRNVLIYFDQPTKAKLMDAIAQQMPADGILYLGAAETVLGITSGHWGVSTTQTAEEGALRGLADSKVPEECRHAERVSRTPDGYRRCSAASLRCVGRGGCHDRALQHRRQSGRSRFAWDHPYPYLYRPHQGWPYRSGCVVDHHAGDRYQHSDRRQLGFWLRRDRPRDALHDRQGGAAAGRRGDGLSPEPYRQARVLSIDGGARRHDRDDHRRFRPQCQSGGAVRWRKGKGRHKSDLLRRAVEP